MKDLEKVIDVKNVSVNYGEIRALDNVSLHFNNKEIIGIVGTNGAGKSTILRAIFGLTKIDSGDISFLTKKINKRIPHEMIKHGISFIPQGNHLFLSLSIEENLEMGSVIEKDKKEIKKSLERIYSLFPDLYEKRNNKASELSGGQQQMLALGRGLMTNPDLILLDEPSIGLSPKITKEVFEKIIYINELYGATIIIVEHNISALFSVVNRVYVFDKGKIVLEDKPKNLIESGSLKNVFMGNY